MQNGVNEMLYSIEAKMRQLASASSSSSSTSGGLTETTFLSVFGSSHVLVPTKIVTTSGTETAGAKSIAFHPSSSFQGSINGVPHTFIRGSMIYNAHQGMTLPAISYVITSGELCIERFD